MFGVPACGGQATPRTIVQAEGADSGAAPSMPQAAISEPKTGDQIAAPIAISPVAQIAQSITDELSVAARQATATAATLEQLRTAGQTDRAAASDFVRGIVESSPDILGASTVWQPDAYDGRDVDFAVVDLQNPDTGQFLVYWARGADGSIKQAKINHTKLVAKGSWLSPMTSGRPYVSEPYSFAIAGVSRISATISVPILDPTGVIPEPLGVYSIDIPLHSVEAGLQSESLPKDARVILVDRNNDLATDSDPAWQPGSGLAAPGEPFASYLIESRGDPTMDITIEWSRKIYRLAVAPVLFNGDQRIWRLMMLTPSK